MDQVHYWMHYIVADIFLLTVVFWAAQYVFNLVVERIYSFKELHGWSIVRNELNQHGYTDWREAFCAFLNHRSKGN